MKEYSDKHQHIFEKDGLIFIEYTCSSITLEVARKTVEQRAEIMAGRVMPTVVDGCKVMYANRAALKYAASEEGVKGMSCGALIVRNKIHEIISNFFLLLLPKVLPTKIFSDKENAVKWAREIDQRRLDTMKILQRKGEEYQ